MAWAGPTQTFATTSSGGTQLLLSTSGTMAVGTLLLVAFCQDNTFGVSLVDDDSTGAGGKNVYVPVGPVASAAGVQGYLYYSVLTRPTIGFNTQIRITLLGAPVTLVGRYMAFTGNDRSYPFDKASGQNNAAGSPFSMTGAASWANGLGIFASYWQGANVNNGMTETLAGWTAQAYGGASPVAVDISYSTTFDTTPASPSHSFTTAPTTICGHLAAFAQPGWQAKSKPQPSQQITRRVWARS